ncbi:MAG: hypothetical protein J6X53_03680 [Abditibacteriota bacterium]|nr:hypothetical protein [Abditibacteriota bacterium]
MADNVFPSNSTDALAYLFVQRQDLNGKTAEQIFDLYAEAKDAISKRSDERQNERKPKRERIPW